MQNTFYDLWLSHLLFGVVKRRENVRYYTMDGVNLEPRVLIGQEEFAITE